MNDFCLKQGLGLKASAANLYPDFPRVPPSPPDNFQLHALELFHFASILVLYEEFMPSSGLVFEKALLYSAAFRLIK